MGNLRYFLARADHPVARAARWARSASRSLSVPAPRLVYLPLVWLWGLVQLVYYLLKRKFIAEPFLKVQCLRYGPRLRTGNFVHWISGRGEIVLGADVHLDGKADIMFAVIFPELPRLEIGDRTYVNHRAGFGIARSVTIGRDVYVAGNVRFMDSPGHPLDPAERLAKRPPSPDQVRPIRVHDNVWIGTDVIVLPGSEIGEGSVIAAGAVVSGRIPPYSLAGGVPARVLRSLLPEAADAAAPAPTAPGPLPGALAERR
jgi:acetyltransferase-like isoleucine patch superfamily enzyme